MKILLVGGGSGGPVAPLLAVARAIKKNHQKTDFLLVGGKSGPEKLMAQNAGLAFEAINAGKLRRYFSLKNFGSPFLTLAGFIQSLKILKKFKPDCVFGTGSFIQVPMVWAAGLLNIPVVLHQQDVAPSLANRLCQLMAKKITVSFESSLKDFASSLGVFYKKNQDKVILTGNPFREELKEGSRQQGLKIFNLKSDLPTLLVLGGGTGAEFINELIKGCLPKLSKSVQIIHSTGAGKQTLEESENYHPFEFIKDMGEAYAVADIVLARAGLSTLAELSNLKKVSIIIPIPQSHQEINALYLAHTQAAITLNQNRTTPNGFTALIRKLLFAHDFLEVLKENIEKVMPHNSGEMIAEIIVKESLKDG